LRSTVVGENIFVPDEISGSGFETAQFALGAQRVDAPVVPHRRGARSVAAEHFGEERLPGVGPAFAPGGDIVGGHHFAIAALFDGKGQAVGRGE
jgi:hypothetical protein